MWLFEFFDFSHLLSAVGLAVAGWQILRNRKLKMARKTDAFELYVKSSFILINAHRCINLLKKEFKGRGYTVAKLPVPRHLCLG